MKKEIKQDWIRALRSGRFKLSSRYLRVDDGKYSSVGVLYDLREGKWLGPAPQGPADPSYRYYSVPRPEDKDYPESVSLIPEYFRKSVGLDKGVLNRIYKKQMAGYAHSQIADYLQSLKRV